MYGDGTLEALDWCVAERTKPGAWILGTCLAAYCGRLHSMEVLRQVPAKLAGEVAGAIIVAASAYEGEWERAQGASGALSSPCPASLRAAGFAALQQFDRAVAEGRDASGLAPMTLVTWLLELERNDDAESLLNAVRVADRFDERPYEALLGLYAPKAPLASEEKLGATAKVLRDAIPESRIAASVSAREAFSHGQWRAASEALRAWSGASTPEPMRAPETPARAPPPACGRSPLRELVSASGGAGAGPSTGYWSCR
jgi:hypothetical protein